MLKIHTSAAIWEWQSISLKRSISLRCCGLALFSKCVYKNSFLQICGYLFVPVHIFISFHWNSPLISSCNERQKAFRNLVMHLQKSCSSPCLSRGDNSGTKLKTLGTGGGGGQWALVDNIIWFQERFSRTRPCTRQEATSKLKIYAGQNGYKREEAWYHYV